ncbi:MAG: acyl-CoA dehydratase activase [Bacillota bacterium]
MSEYLGIDVGSVSTNLCVLSGDGEVLESLYLETRGRPIEAVSQGLAMLAHRGFHIAGVGTTGSGRYLARALVGGDVCKNEITAHAVAALHEEPDVHTIIEIGGQDSKIIIIRNGVVVDFAMNTVCAAGTGSFLDRQAARLGVPIERFGELAGSAREPVRIAGRCAVFAESDMIHKQQVGHPVESIVKGLCEALVRNYLNNVGKGKDIREIVMFQGGVACNSGMVSAFEEALGMKVRVPPHCRVMGAIGAALLAKKAVRGVSTRFRGFDVAMKECRTETFACTACANRCEVVKLLINQEKAGFWGGRCGRWEHAGSGRGQDFPAVGSMV